MKFPAIFALIFTALTGAGHAQEVNEVREASKTEAETFNARMFGGPPGHKAYACFVRRYDAEHLARHPKQKVASMKLLVSAEYDREGKELHYSGFVSAEKGGVVRLAELQSQSYLYLRP
jgi:hypothetical protein